MIAENSLFAYRSLEGLSEKQKEVFSAIAVYGKPINNRLLSLRLGWAVNRVTPRVLELREAGFVREAVSAIDQRTRRRASFWVIDKGEIKEFEE